MCTQTVQPQNMPFPDEIEIRSLNRQLLDSWNRRSAEAFATLFASDGYVIMEKSQQDIEHGEDESQQKRRSVCLL